ncbi:3',5'-cyclic-nucleotide phosphodiesterase PDE2 KNAG_0E00250 [Huiozyma naganishii CBS 8797]|uniref:Phosphodiesterase n=1 Tax=Huiozyma naganishii (strain ATCC MYA-139 / BCRC 22969 / CBS 8797 / KCTC 17520 / NBRC 10181 / NCYC 3082 / Yp74L-3) TaxID=1071383 RepID=J7RLA2_HUIN7|nr:hypothetical protein KNAG_0E00250 [Kazachstania naganishii CBS 8797]CCK70293.1 hypothetical protein KNAG_0E00250 [Kazachstania naganishii CBS 8797]
MATLFLIGGAESPPLLESGLFDREVLLRDAETLLRRLYSDRVYPLPNPWNYESGVSLVVLPTSGGADDRAGRGSGAEEDAVLLNKLFGKFFPTFNIRAVSQFAVEEDLATLLDMVQQERQLCRDRTSRMDHWMHHDVLPAEITDDSHRANSTCQNNLYSMLKHFHAAQGTDLRVPRVLRNIRFSELVEEVDAEGPTGPDTVEQFQEVLNTWEFSALNLTTLQLIKCGFYILHTLSQRAKVPTADNKLYLLLFTLEASYHQINRFHNFKHAIDVMQATWKLCSIILPQDHRVTLLLCLAAIGHDVGHPGTNNALFKQESGTSRMFQGHSVLENFHYQIFSSILRSLWPTVFSLTRTDTEHKNLIESAILATDMSIHQKYVDILTERSTSDVPLTVVETISLIIKAADISNVTRPLHVSAKWAFLITLEFKDCAALQEYLQSRGNSTNSCHCAVQDSRPREDYDMEFEIEMHELINSTPFSLDLLLKKYPAIPAGQIFFINTFAFEFFDKLAKIFPDLRFLIENVESNKQFWIKRQESRTSS